MSHTHTSKRVRNEDKEPKQNPDKPSHDNEKPGEDSEQTTSMNQSEILSEEEIRELGSRSSEFTWEDFYSVFEGQIA